MDMTIFDFFIIACGAYFLYTAIQMKRTGEINQTTLVGKNIDLSKAKDKEGFIKAIYGKSVFIGVLTMICGIINILNAKYLSVPYLGVAISIVYIILIGLYCKFSLDAQKKYLIP